MRIRIMHVVDTLETGGLENGVVNLIQRMDPARFEHIVCAMRNLGPLADRLPASRVRIMCLDKAALGFSFLAGQLARRIRQESPHIVHSRNWGTMEAILAGWWHRGAALVHSEHGVESADAGSEPIRRRIFRRLVYHLADKVFSVSYQLRDYHARRTGFPASRMEVIHNGVDTGRFCPDPSTRDLIRRRLGIRPEEFCIGAVGRLEPVKDLRTLLRAVAAFPQACTNWRLLIAGDGRDLPALREFVNSRSELQSRIAFLGDVSNIPDVLNALDTYVISSRSEGISNSLLEAMATGLPVVASAVGGNLEVINEGSGLLFPTEDYHGLAERLLVLRGDSELRRRLGRSALLRVKQDFSMESMVSNYERLYGSLATRQATVPLPVTRTG